MTYSQSVTVAVCVTYIVSGYFPSPPSTDASTRCLEQCHKSVQCFSRYLLALSLPCPFTLLFIQSQSQTEMRFLILIALFAVAVFAELEETNQGDVAAAEDLLPADETPEVVNVYEDEVDGQDETAEDAPLDPEPAVEPDADAEPEPVADAEPEPTPERGIIQVEHVQTNKRTNRRFQRGVFLWRHRLRRCCNGARRRRLQIQEWSFLIPLCVCSLWHVLFWVTFTKTRNEKTTSSAITMSSNAKQ